jgi:hypothetical protein
VDGEAAGILLSLQFRKKSANDPETTAKLDDLKTTTTITSERFTTKESKGETCAHK